MLARFIAMQLGVFAAGMFVGSAISRPSTSSAVTAYVLSAFWVVACVAYYIKQG